MFKAKHVIVLRDPVAKLQSLQLQRNANDHRIGDQKLCTRYHELTAIYYHHGERIQTVAAQDRHFSHDRVSCTRHQSANTYSVKQPNSQEHSRTTRQQSSNQKQSSSQSVTSISQSAIYCTCNRNPQIPFRADRCNSVFLVTRRQRKQTRLTLHIDTYLQTV